MTSVTLSILALVVSIFTAAYAALVSRRISNRSVTSAAITDYYSSMRDLTKLQMQEWRLAHLFEVQINYQAVTDQLRAVAPPSSEPHAVELVLKERAAALTIFGLYEHVIYQMDGANNDGDEERTAFLTDAADYFTERLLPNPRLRYLWAGDGGNLECEFEEKVRAHYADHVDANHHGWDDKGPYG